MCFLVALAAGGGHDVGTSDDHSVGYHMSAWDEVDEKIVCSSSDKGILREVVLIARVFFILYFLCDMWFRNWSMVPLLRSATPDELPRFL